jgi:DNA-binding transcriptional ArsR family regulator
MWRIHFAPDDLARIRLGRDADAGCEIARSLRILAGQAGEPVFGQWRRRARARLGASWRRLGPELAAGQPDHRLARRYFDQLLAPYWPRIRQLVGTETRRLGDVVAHGGAARMLSEVSPLLRWDAPTLRIADKPDERDIFLRGRGIVLQPSFFAHDDCGLHESADGTPVLIYPLRLEAGWFDAEPVCGRQALRTLLGATRALVLERLAQDRCTTSELAAVLELSVASASQHANVLREAGLVSSNQRGKTVVHKASSLGVRLIERVHCY